MNRAKIPNVLTRQHSDSAVLHNQQEKLLVQQEDTKTTQYLDFPESTNEWQVSQWRKRSSSSSSSTQLLSPSLNKLRKRVSITISEDPLLYFAPNNKENDQQLSENKNRSRPVANKQKSEQKLEGNSAFAFPTEQREPMHLQSEQDIERHAYAYRKTAIETNTTTHTQQVSTKEQEDCFLSNWLQNQECSSSNSPLHNKEDIFPIQFPEITDFSEYWRSIENDIHHHDNDTDQTPFFWPDFF